MSQTLRAYLLCRYAADHSLYRDWMSKLAVPSVCVDTLPVDWPTPEDAGIVITHEHYRWEEVSTLRRIVNEGRVPTLVLADGVLEYRNTFQNSTVPDGSIFQPVLAHKIACLGAASARMLQSWGNAGKVEVVGLPRLDHLLSRSRKPRDRDQSFRLLVATATTPAFDEQQRVIVLNSLRSLKEKLEASSEIDGRKLQVTWRLTSGLDQELGLPSTADDAPPLADAIESSDAVITSPSTIYLESALLGRPTAILDFHNVPSFVPSAWTISANSQITFVLDELARPPAAKLWYQEYALADALSYQTPATERLLSLVHTMIDVGREARASRQPLKLPAQILPIENPTANGLAGQLRSFYPGNVAYKMDDTTQLQAELSQAQFRLGTLPREIADKNRQITQLQASLDESRRRVADVRARLFKLRKLLGIGKENQADSVNDNPSST